MSSNTGRICLFCNEGTEEEPDLCHISVTVDSSDVSGEYLCHGSCLQEATHPAVPLYLLSLHRDEAVYGTNQQLDAKATRTLSEKESFRAAGYFLEQFNEREKSEALYLLVAWMSVTSWDQDPPLTADPAQWSDWMSAVDRVLAERSTVDD